VCSVEPAGIFGDLGDFASTLARSLSTFKEGLLFFLGLFLVKLIASSFTD
jgi:hypothetical protein